MTVSSIDVWGGFPGAVAMVPWRAAVGGWYAQPAPTAIASPTSRGASRAARITLLHAVESKRGRVHAVAKSRGPRTVVEHVTEVAAAARAQHFVALAIAILAHRDVRGGDRLVEAGPSGAGLELGLGAVEGEAAAGATVDALVVHV